MSKAEFSDISIDIIDSLEVLKENILFKISEEEFPNNNHPVVTNKRNITLIFKNQTCYNNITIILQLLFL